MSSTPRTDTRPLTSQRMSLIRAGAGLGLRVGLWLSVSYAFLGTFSLALATAPLSEIWIGFFLLLLVAVLVFIFLIIPTALFLAGTGALLGKLAESISGKIGRAGFVALSTATCVIIALATHYLLRIPVVLSFHASIIFRGFGPTPFTSYPFLIGIPTFIFVGAGAWAGEQLYAKARGQKAAWNIPGGWVKRGLVAALAILIPTIIALKVMGWFDYASTWNQVDNIRFQMWASTRCPAFGETVHYRALFKNVGTQTEVIRLNSKPVFDLCAFNKCWSDGKPLTPELTNLELKPGEEKLITLDDRYTQGPVDAVAVVNRGESPSLGDYVMLIIGPCWLIGP